MSESLYTTRRTKVGRYPLQKTGSETRADVYESADYLYEHPAGYVWLRTVHDLKSQEHSLAIEFVHQGFKFSQWQKRVVGYTERNLCRLARAFAEEKSRSGNHE